MALGDAAFAVPLVTTAAGVIIDGHARVEVARRQHRPTVHSLEYDVGDDEALQLLIAAHRQSGGFNTFSRVGLALQLESSLRERARDHQREGARNKGSSTLTQAERLDVRCEIGKIAAASTGTVTKVKQLLVRAIPEVLEALRVEEVSIDRAWQWSRLESFKQHDMLQGHRSEEGVRKTIRGLLARQKARLSPVPSSTARLVSSDLNAILEGISNSARNAPVEIVLAPVDISGNFIVVSRQLYESLNVQRELDLR
jgi:hypothetical protein